MQKRSPDYDDVFKTMKTKHREFFIPLINEIYGTHFSADDDALWRDSEFTRKPPLSCGMRQILLAND